MSDIIQSFQNKAVAAPLAGISNLPFRLIAREFGCGLCFTEMISANGLIRESSKTIEYLNTCPEDQPLGIQIFGTDPSLMADAARMVARHHPNVIDINMGCPVRKVIKTGAGAMLMKDPPLVGRIIESVVKAVNIPVTVKIRAGWSRNSVNAVQISKIAEKSGAVAIIVHGRTADQGFSGQADWGIIRDVKNAVKIPVVGNGDIWHAEDALRMRRESGCDGVMVGRGALGNPWLFHGIHQLFRGISGDYQPSAAERHDVVKKHWDMEVKYSGSRIAERSFRKHLLWYTKGLPGSGRLRDAVGKMTDSSLMFAELERYFLSLNGSQPEIMT